MILLMVLTILESLFREPAVSPSSEGKVLGTCAAELRDPPLCLPVLYLERSIPEIGFGKRLPALTRCGGALKMRCSLPGHTAATLRDPWKAGAPNQPFSPTFPRYLSFLEPLSLPLSVFPSFR